MVLGPGEGTPEALPWTTRVASGWDTLLVTSASVRLSQQTLDAAPLSGSVFALQFAGVRGLPETMFAG